MALPEIKQALSVIDKSSSILLAVSGKPSPDAFASMIALYITLLDYHDGAINAVSPDHVPKNLQFLPGSSQVQMKPKIQPEIVIDIAGQEAAVHTRQEKLNGGARIHLSLSENVAISQDNLEMHIRQLPYDAVITFGISDLEELGSIFTKHADFFYNTPIINIDNQATNEHFGTINIVDITSSSIAEATYDLIASIAKEDLPKGIPTALYAGIVTATDSFQKPATTPRAFQLAAKLMDKKADKEAVIQHLVKTKPLYLLKLAGRTYARLRFDEYGQLFWSILRPIDFQESGANTSHIPEVMQELTGNISGFNAMFLLHESGPRQYAAYLLPGKGLKSRNQQIMSALKAEKHNDLITIPIQAENIQEAEKISLEKIREILPKNQ